MKKIGSSIAVVIVIVCSFTVAAAAQNRVLGRADIPFGFSAHGQHFNTGTYELRQVGLQIVRLQEVTTGRGVTLISPQSIGESSTTNIVFRGYGSRRFLAAVIAPSYQISLPKSQAETELAVTANMTTEALRVQH